MPLIVDIKNQIKTLLDELKTAGTLGEVQVDDFKTNIFDRDIATYPVAILTTPSVEAGYLTNRENERTHNFEIVVITKGENVASATDVEALIETILDKFDNQPTLNGKATEVVPSTSVPEAITLPGGNSFIVFSVLIKAKAIKLLTF